MACIGQPMHPGYVARRAFQHIRHGTKALIAISDLGEKRKSGVRRPVAKRETFLRDAGNRSTFHVTPKHAPWMNQIEIQSSILVRKRLRRGNYRSKEHRQQSIEVFIADFNATMAKPFRWTMESKRLVA
jgi:hypothetical protein